MKLTHISILIMLSACGAVDDRPTGEGEPVSSITSGLYKISFNVPPGGLPQINCLGSDPPNTWSYYGNICTAEDGIKSNQIFWTYGKGEQPYQDDGCVCIRVLDPSYKCWITLGAGPDLSRDKDKYRQARSYVAATDSNWLHRDARNYQTPCAVNVMRCQQSVGCPSQAVAF